MFCVTCEFGASGCIEIIRSENLQFGYSVCVRRFIRVSMSLSLKNLSARLSELNRFTYPVLFSSKCSKIL